MILNKSPEKLYYQIDVHTKSFKHKSLPIRQRIQSQYLPKYWKKLKLDQKIIKPNQQDRLSKLTVKQIDRIIDMEKIKYILNGKKNGNQELYLDKYNNQTNQNQNVKQHPNVYRANFLSKINKIAIERKIFTQQAEGFQSIYGQFNPQTIRKRQLQKQKQNIKYVKVYKSNKNNKKKVSLYQMNNQFSIQDQKSISSIQYEKNLQDFQQNFNKNQAKNYSLVKRKNPLLDDKKLLCNRRWFDGMSTHYVEKKCFFKQQNWVNKNIRSMDISSVMEKRRSKVDYKNNENQRRRSQILNCKRVRTEYDIMNNEINKNGQGRYSITRGIDDNF